jgi:UDP-N-acetylmuramoylalanine--D-glutamate ligase
MWHGKKVYLVGAGKSGLAAARWLIEQGAIVCMNDSKPLSDLSEGTQIALSGLADKGLILELGMDPSPLRWKAVLVLASPGVPIDLPPIVEAMAEGVMVTNEIELGWQICKAQIVGVTGSNGKTTVTSLIGQMAADAGYAPFVGGNIGTPFIEAAPGMSQGDWAILELSSFQLAGIRTMKPRIAVFLNLTPDHLDWHGTFENYAAAKWNIARDQTCDDWLILNYDDPLIYSEGMRRLGEAEAYLDGHTPVEGPRIVWFSRKAKLDSGIYVDCDGWAVCCIASVCGGEETRIIQRDSFALPGAHNLENLLAALASGLAAGISPQALAKSCASFRGGEHRMEAVGEYGGVLCVNDSKATNPDSAIKALESYDRPIIIIAGGDSKGVEFHAFAKKISEKAKAAVLIGRDRDRIKQSLEAIGYDTIHLADSLEKAVAVCHDLAEPEDIVLLAPACASFDMFNNYEERGRLFKAAVEDTFGGSSPLWVLRPTCRSDENGD